MYEHVARILSVDLGTGERGRSVLPEEVASPYIGGRGWGARLLLDVLPPDVNPLSPENVLFFLTGPLTGTPLPGSGKYLVVTKSPATGAFCESYSSGLLAPALRFAGYDVLQLTGRAAEPSYLYVEDDYVELRSAEDLWGLDAFEAETELRDRYGHRATGVAVIGPAGENLVKLATIGSDYYRHAARGGVGAVMGSKNLKAIVIRGSQEIPVADIDRVMAIQRRLVEQVRSSPGAQRQMNYGTTSTLAITNEAGMLPTRNFQEGVFPEAWGHIDPEGIKKITVGRAGCYACIMPCARLVEVERNDECLRLEGPEYETLAMLGSNLGISDSSAVVAQNLACDRLGLDVISAGVVVGFAMECAERGLLSDSTLEDMRFGDADAALQLLDDIAHRRGLGDLLAEGVARAAEEIGKGSERFAMHVKGLEFPAYDPRAGFGGGLIYAVTPRGACHRRAWPPAVEVLSDAPPYEVEGKAKLVKKLYDERTILHSLLVCDFHHPAVPLGIDDYAELLSAVTGTEWTAEDLQVAADRIETTARLFNIREGFGREDDRLPLRILEEPLPEGPAAGQLFGQDGLDVMLDEYYEVRGWDRAGVPLPETLEWYGISTDGGQA